MKVVNESLNKNKFIVICLLVIIAVLGFGIARLVFATRGGVATGNSAAIGWGVDDSGQLGTGSLAVTNIAESPKNVKMQHATTLSGGLRHTLALTTDGSVWAWGSNTYGQLGNGKKGGKRVTPEQVQGLSKITMIATRQDNNLALDDKGRVWAWGLNMSGQMGNGNNEDVTKPQIVKGISDVAYIATGYRSSIAVKRDGSVWTWGGNCNLQSRDVTIRDYITQLAVSGYTDTAGGTIDDITPEDNCTQEKYLNIKSYKPKKIEGLPPVVSVSAGFGHVLALTSSGDVWSWGCNLFGQVGNGIDHNTDANLKPARIKELHGITEISAGFRHSVALTRDGELWGWGHNYFGELGNGKTSDSKIHASPAKITSIKDVKYVAAGHDYTVAITDKDELWGWGQATFGQLGGLIDNKPRPIRIFNLEKVQTVAAGGGHVIVLSGAKGEL